MGSYHLTSPWSEERIQQLRALWDTGLSASKIARQLGLSKNGVVGKAHRLKLPGRPSPINMRGQRLSPMERRAQKLAAALVECRPPRAEEPQALPTAAEPAYRLRWGRPRPKARIAACQFIEADKEHYTDADKCGAAALEHSAYCAHHHARCWRIVPRKEAA